MVIVAKERQSGKTTLLLKASSVNKIPILVNTEQQRMNLKYLAKELNIEIPEPITVNHLKERGRRVPYSVYIDNAELVLSSLLGCGIEAISVSTNEEQLVEFEVQTVASYANREIRKRLDRIEMDLKAIKRLLADIQNVKHI